MAVFNAIQGAISAVTVTYILLTPDIINQDFINYDFGFPASWITIFAIIITIVAVVLDSYEGFKKSRL